MMATLQMRTQPVPGSGVDITVAEIDRARTYLLLHGGGGPPTMAGFASLLAERARARVLVPTHPGFAGTTRPDSLSSTRDLAAAYVALLDELDLTDVTVVGNSFGGWLAAEIALLHSPRVTAAIIVDAVGVSVDGHPITDVSTLSPPELVRLSFHDPSRAPAPPAGAATGAGPAPNIAALVAYTGPAMSDPTLLDRLGGIDIPVRVLWGASDGIADAEYGKALAAAIPGADFAVLPQTGHMPQVETPAELLDAIVG